VTVCLSLFIPVSHLAILSPAAIVGGLYLLLAGFRLLARKRSLLAPTSSKIGSASPGLIEVSGMTAGLHTITAPISGEPCFLYRTTAWQQTREQKWEKVAEENLYLPFFISDSTGQLLIEPPGADLDLLRNFREEYEPFSFSSNVVSQDVPQGEDKHEDNTDKEKHDDDVPPRVRSFLSRHGIVPVRRLRIEECAIKPKDALVVAGTLTENPGAPAHPLSQSSEQGGEQASGTTSDLRDGVPSADSVGHESPLPPAPNTLPEPLPVVEVIRLAAGAAASSSSHMTQQGKITAALTRANIGTEEVWSGGNVPPQGGNVPPHYEAVENNSQTASSFGGGALSSRDGAEPRHHTIGSADFDVLLQLVEAQRNGVPANDVPANDVPASDVPANDAPATKAQRSDYRRNEVRLEEVRVHEAPSNDDAAFPGFDAPVVLFNAPVVVKKNANNPTFVISYRSQKEFASALAWKSTAMLWGGGAITLLGTYALLAKMFA